MKKTLLTALVLTAVLPLSAYAGGSHGSHGGHGAAPMKMEKKSTMAMGVGVVQSVNHANRSINLSHEAIPALRWPAMIMDLSVSNDVNLNDIKVNDKIKFHIMLGADKTYRITKIMGSQSGVSALGLNKQKALSTLVQGINVMEKTGSDKYIKEMLAGGPIMDVWHETTEGIYEGVEVLETYMESLSDAQQKKSLEVALEDYNDVLDTFHMVTHDAEAKEAQIAISGKVAEARLVLKRLERLIK